MIIKAKFISIWDDDDEIITNCPVNTDTLEVFDIEQSEEESEGICTGQYVLLGDTRHEVFERGEAEDGEYWYE